MDQEENFYEDMVHGRDLKEKKFNFRIIVVLFLIAILGFGAYITYLKFQEKPEPVEESKTPEEEVMQEVEFDCDEVCEYTLQVGGEDVVVNYSVSATETDHFLHRVSIAGSIVVNRDFACGGPTTLKVLDDILLISYHDGCDVGGNTLHAYDKTGVELFSYEYLDTTYNMWMSGTDFEIEDKKIKIAATRMYQGTTMRLNTNAEIDLCNKDEWIKYSEMNEDTITSGVYEITYYGSSSFSDPMLISSTTVKDEIKNCPVSAE